MTTDGNGQKTTDGLSLTLTPFEDQLTLLQRKIAVNRWRGMQSEVRHSMAEYHQLVDALYFNRWPDRDHAL